MEKLLSKEKVSQKIKDWKADIIQLKEQLDDSMENAGDAFEKQKDNLRDWTKKFEKELHKLEELTEEKANLFKGKLQNLRGQLVTGKAETEVIFKEQQQKINQAIKDLKQAISGFTKNPEGQFGDFWEKKNQRLEKFQMSFDLFKLQLNLGKKEAQQTWMEKKKEINSKLQELEIKLKKENNVALEQMDRFLGEISDSLKRLKKAIKG